MAQSVRIRTFGLLTVVAAGAAAGVSRLDDDHSWWLAARCVVAVVVGVACSGLLLERCVRRLGGVTGDVLGALVECATTAALLCFALL